MTVAIVLGVLMAGSFSFMMTMILIDRSNVLGNDKGTFEDFSNSPIRMISQRDGIEWTVMK